jgi:hypothetical protein
VIEKTEMDNLPVSNAAFCLIKDIEAYHKVGGLKKELSRLYAQISAMNEILAEKKSSDFGL